MTDWELLEDYVSRRSEAAFARLVERHWRMVLAACRRETCDLCLAEDAAQVAFLVLARRAGTLRRKGNLAAWLFVTARLTARNACRNEKRRMDLQREAAEMTDGTSNDDRGTWPHLVPFLNDAIASLRPADRNIVLLRYFEDLNTSETAVELGISEAAVRTRLSRAIERLRLYFTRHGLFLTGVALAALLQEERADAAIPVGLAAHLAKMAVGGPANPSLLPNASRLSQLMKGVQKQMLLAKLKVTAVVIGVAAIGTGAAVKAMETAPRAARTPKIAGNSTVLPSRDVPLTDKADGAQDYGAADLLMVGSNAKKPSLLTLLTGISAQGQVFGWSRFADPKPGGEYTNYSTRSFIASRAGTRYLDDVEFDRIDDGGRAVGELFSRSCPIVYQGGRITPLPLPAGCRSGSAEQIAGNFIAGEVWAQSNSPHICLWTRGRVEDVTSFLPGDPQIDLVVAGLDSHGDILLVDSASRFRTDFWLLTAAHKAIDLHTDWAYLNERGDLLIQRGSGASSRILHASSETGAAQPIEPLAHVTQGGICTVNRREDILFAERELGAGHYYLVSGDAMMRLNLPDAVQHARCSPMLGARDQIAVIAPAADGKDHVFLMTSKGRKR